MDHPHEGMYQLVNGPRGAVFTDELLTDVRILPFFNLNDKEESRISRKS